MGSLVVKVPELVLAQRADINHELTNFDDRACVTLLDFFSSVIICICGQSTGIGSE